MSNYKCTNAFKEKGITYKYYDVITAERFKAISKNNQRWFIKIEDHSTAAPYSSSTTDDSSSFSMPSFDFGSSASDSNSSFDSGSSNDSSSSSSDFGGFDGGSGGGAGAGGDW